MSSTGTSTQPWKTAVTDIEPNHVYVRGHDIAECMGELSFGGMVYLLLMGERPDEKIARLMDAILVSSIDHGVTPPSTLAARTVASTGGALNASVAAGVLSINEYHGGAIEKCAHQLRHIIHQTEEHGNHLDQVAEAIIAELKESGERMSGFGHRVHTNDPRAARLFELAEQAGVTGTFIEAAKAVARVFKSAGKELPINVDGAIAAVLGDLGFDPHTMNGLFMIARTPGLIAHATEEKQRQRPMRRIDPNNYEYDGAKKR